MTRLVLFLAAVALVTACADRPASHPAPTAPAARNQPICRSGYMVAYNQATGQWDSTYTGCTP